MAKHTVIEIGTQEVKGATGEFRKNSFFIDKVDIQPAEKDFYVSSTAAIFNRQVKTVSNVFKNLKSRSKKVSIIIPDEITYNHFMVFPKLREKELYSAVKFQADQFIPLPLEKISIDIDILEETEDRKNLLLMVVSVEKLHLTKITNLCESIGIIPVRIENQLSSLGKTLTYADIKNPPNSIFVLLNQQTTALYFYEEQRKLIFNTHTFKIGSELFAKELALTANISLEEAKKLLMEVGLNTQDARLEQLMKPLLADFVSELKQSLNLAQSKHSVLIKNLVFLNPNLMIKGFQSYIANKLQINASDLDLSSAVRFKSKSLNNLMPKAVLTTVGGLII